MHCSQCGSELQPGFQFCPECGQPVPSLLDPNSPPPTVVDPPSSGDWILTIVSGVNQGASYPIGDKLVIGREAACDVILNDTRVSRRHASIERTGKNSFRLVDHDSANGTFVNEERIEGTAMLFAGSAFRLGDSIMSLVPTIETCSRCGQPIEESVEFCGNCGHPVGTDAEIDLEQLAAEIEQASSQAGRSTGINAPASGALAPPAAVSAAPAKAFPATSSISCGRWLVIWVVVLTVLVAAIACCGLLIPILESL